MAKPSKTNIQPPSKTDVWVPPLTEWDLDSALPANDEFYRENNGQDFVDWLGQINQPAGGPVVDFNNYEYGFFGVNGGLNETVHGHKEMGGVIVTGNGKDTIYGGDKADLIYSGNGKDYVHGGGGNDIIYSENGPDEVWGGKDDGEFSVTLSESESVLTLIPGLADYFAFDPQGSSIEVDVPNNTTVQKEGVHIKVDDDGLPIEFSGGEPLVHVVYSITPETSGWYTIAYTKGNALDGPGNPEPDQFAVELEAGQKYFFSFIDDDGGGPVRVDVFAGNIVITSPINDGPGGNPGSVATSQAMPVPDWEDYFEETEIGGDPIVSFDAGDHLIGGNGPDTFGYEKGDGVDVIWDFELTDLDAGFAGDTLVIKGFGLANDSNGDDIFDLEDLKTAEHDGTLVIGFDDGSGGWLADSAIKLEGYGLGDFEVLKTQIEIQSS